MGRIKRPCRRPGCSALVVSGYCEAHTPTSTYDSSAKRFDQMRGSSYRRGYDAVWQRYRDWYLKRHPACEDCGRLASQVHHIQKLKEHRELRCVESNCMALCESCHSKRTARGE